MSRFALAAAAACLAAAARAQQMPPSAPAPPGPPGTVAAPHAHHAPHAPDAPDSAQEPDPPRIRLLDASLTLLGAAGWSTEPDTVLADLQGGGHDPRKRGFTLQQAEFGLAGEVDGWLRAEAYLIAFPDPYEGETIVELEEAFASTTALPAGFAARAGHFFTGFGLHNVEHPHEWDWLDQPVIHTRVFGADGMRGTGARLAWHTPLGGASARLQLDVQNAVGETMHSFLASEEAWEERPVGGRAFTEREVHGMDDLLWTARAALQCEAAGTIEVGASLSFGPNATGAGADTLLYGADFRWVCGAVGHDDAPSAAHDHGATADDFAPFSLQGELVGRAFEAAAQVDDSVPATPVALPATTLKDLGGYLQALWGFAPGWAVGLRGEYAGGSGASYDPATQTFSRAADPFRADRLRLSPLLAFRPSPAARVRLQYNYDDTDALADAAHSVWLGFEVRIGAHEVHR